MVKYDPKEPITQYKQCELCYTHGQCDNDGESWICDIAISCKHRQDAIQRLQEGIAFDIYECPYCYAANVVAADRVYQGCNVCSTTYGIAWKANQRIDYIYQSGIGKVYRNVSMRFVAYCTCCAKEATE